MTFSVKKAEMHLAAREVDNALAVYTSLDRSGYMDADRIDGGRWMCHMLAGEYETAWCCSDAIRRRGAEDAHRFWQGEPIDGKRLMLRCLHGYGDTVMYLRWLPELRLRCSEVMVQACPEMLPLIRAMVRPTSENPAVGHMAPVRVMSWTAQGESDREHWDVQVECAELPYLFRATTATLPEPVLLTFAEADLHRIRTCLGERTKPRVGLVWTGSNYDPARSVPFAQLLRLLRDHNVEFWSLQAFENNHDWTHFCAERGLSARTFYTHGETATELRHAGIADMAAFASEMDLVITIDTMAAHIAGSLGLPTWLLLKREADWRWMLDREDSPWYPTLRLFRQRTTGDWDAPLTGVCDALRDFYEEMQA
ncbi:hypothetical protein [Terriglobus sp.]|uniref:hypothetical protein n=1 Tax=Terriglobus sp. TaxID=1889013 RepID=UPI003AFFACE0